MFEILQKFVLLVASTACVVAICVVAMRVARDLNQRFKKYRGRKLINLAKELGPCLYRNSVAGTTAICRVSDFKTTSRSQKNIKPWEPMNLVKVRPTFPFCKVNDPTRTKMHVVATPEEFEAMAEELVTKLTGYTRKQVDKSSFERAARLLIATNIQLFVPFAQDLSDEEGQKQMEFYNSTPPFYEIRKYLIS